MYKLIELHGGGSCPEQYFGTTENNDEIYVRIRYGHITIDKDSITILDVLDKNDTWRGGFKPGELFSSLKDSGCVNSEEEIESLLNESNIEPE